MSFNQIHLKFIIIDYHSYIITIDISGLWRGARDGRRVGFVLLIIGGDAHPHRTVPLVGRARTYRTELVRMQHRSIDLRVALTGCNRSIRLQVALDLAFIPQPVGETIVLALHG